MTSTPNAPKAAALAVAEALQLARKALDAALDVIDSVPQWHNAGFACNLGRKAIAAIDALAAAPQQVAEPEQVTVTVEEMVESVNGSSWWVVLRRGKHRQDDGKYGAAFRNRAEWHAAGLRWILGQADKPKILDFMDAAVPSQASATGEV